MTNDDIALGKVISKLRIDRGLSQEKFAEQVGIHRTYVSQLERGLKSPTLSILRKVAAALDVKPSAILIIAENSSELPH